MPRNLSVTPSLTPVKAPVSKVIVGAVSRAGSVGEAATINAVDATATSCVSVGKITLRRGE